MAAFDFTAWGGKKYEEFKEYANREGWVLKSREDKRDFHNVFSPESNAPEQIQTSGEYFEETYAKTTDWGVMTFKFRCIDGYIFPLSFDAELTQ